MADRVESDPSAIHVGDSKPWNPYATGFMGVFWAIGRRGEAAGLGDACMPPNSDRINELCNRMYRTEKEGGRADAPDTLRALAAELRAARGWVKQLEATLKRKHATLREPGEPHE